VARDNFLYVKVTRNTKKVWAGLACNISSVSGVKFSTKNAGFLAFIQFSLKGKLLIFL